MTAQGVNSVKTAKASICAKLPRPLKAALAAEAERLQMSVNDLAGSLLGEHYSLTFPRSGRRGCRPASAAAQFVVLRLPRLLVEAIRDDAYGKRTNLTHQIVLVLAQALGVQVEVSEPRRTIPLGGGRRRIP